MDHREFRQLVKDHQLISRRTEKLGNLNNITQLLSGNTERSENLPMIIQLLYEITDVLLN